MKTEPKRNLLLVGRLFLVSLAMQSSLLLAAPKEGSARDGAYADTMNLRGPSWVYDNWGIYDPIRRMPLTEDLVLREIDEIARLKKQGVRFDYYMMNAFWYDHDGAYRQWDKRYWPNGPDRWIEACQANGLTPGMWFACNLVWRIGVAPAWEDSYGGDDYRPYGPDMRGAMSMFEGGFMADFIKALQHWYDRGIRVFEFDMADLNAATPASRATLTNREIRQRNKDAFIGALAAFRQKNPEAILVGFNGFKALDKKSMDLDWLEVFETFFSGDTRVPEVPDANYYRTMDNFNDDRVRAMEQAGMPLRRIDPCGNVLSHNVFGIYRKTIAWKSMILQNLSRGSWKQTVYGALEEIHRDEDVRWFAKVQKMYDPLLAKGSTQSFGGIPGEAEPFGFVSYDEGGALYTVVNPAQAVRAITLEHRPGRLTGGRVLFRDAGFVPELADGTVTLGPGQMAVVGFGRFDNQDSDLGIQADFVIPRKIEPRPESFRWVGPNTIEATFIPPANGDLRIVFQQFSPDGAPLRVQTYPLPTDPHSDGPIPDTGMRIEAWQPGFSLPVEQNQRTSAPGISWGLGEVRQKYLIAGRPITIRCTSVDKRPAVLKAQIYSVEY